VSDAALLSALTALAGQLNSGVEGVGRAIGAVERAVASAGRSTNYSPGG
jgi:hypothetical protein